MACPPLTHFPLVTRGRYTTGALTMINAVIGDLTAILGLIEFIRPEKLIQRCVISPHLPRSPQISPDLPASSHLSVHLSFSPRITSSLPRSPPRPPKVLTTYMRSAGSYIFARGALTQPQMNRMYVLDSEMCAPSLLP